MRPSRAQLIATVSLVVVIAGVALARRPSPLEVETARVSRGPLETTVDADGRTRVRERYVITATVAGRLERITLIIAVPVASRDALWSLETISDECICIIAPNHFDGVGQWYRDFTQVSDDEVRMLLAEARRRHEAPRPVLGGVVA